MSDDQATEEQTSEADHATDPNESDVELDREGEGTSFQGNESSTNEGQDDAKAEVEDKIEDGEDVRSAIAAVDGYDGEQGVYLGPSPLRESREHQTMEARAEQSLSPMMKRFHERRHIGATTVVTRRDVNETTQGPGERVQTVEVEDPAPIAGAEPVNGGGQHMPGDDTRGIPGT